MPLFSPSVLPIELDLLKEGIEAGIQAAFRELTEEEKRELERKQREEEEKQRQDLARREFEESLRRGDLLILASKAAESERGSDSVDRADALQTKVQVVGAIVESGTKLEQVALRDEAIAAADRVQAKEAAVPSGNIIARTVREVALGPEQEVDIQGRIKIFGRTLEADGKVSADGPQTVPVARDGRFEPETEVAFSGTLRFPEDPLHEIRVRGLKLRRGEASFQLNRGQGEELDSAGLVTEIPRGRLLYPAAA